MGFSNLPPASQPLQHLLGLPDVPHLVRRKNRETGVQVVAEPRVERRRDLHHVDRTSVGLGDDIELFLLESVEGGEKLTRRL